MKTNKTNMINMATATASSVVNASAKKNIIEKLYTGGAIAVVEQKLPGNYTFVLTGRDKCYIVPIVSNKGYMAYISPKYSTDEFSFLKDLIQNHLDTYYDIGKLACISRDFDPAKVGMNPVEYYEITKLANPKVAVAVTPMSILIPELQDAGYDTSALTKGVTTITNIRDYSALLASNPKAMLRYNTIAKGVTRYGITCAEELPDDVRIAYNAVRFGKVSAMFLIGPAGTGKTIYVHIMSHLMGAPLFTMQGDDGVPREELLGKYVPDEDKENSYKFLLSSLITAIKEGYQMLIDEVNMLPSSITCILNQVLDNTPTITLENGEVIEKHPNFMLYMTMNPGYEGTYALNTAFKSRGIKLVFHRLSMDEFTNRMVNYCNNEFGSSLSEDFFHELYEFSSYIQRLAKEYGESTEICIRNAQQLCGSIMTTGCSYEQFAYAFHSAYTNNLCMDNDNYDNLLTLLSADEFKQKVKALYDLYDYKTILEAPESSLLDLGELFEDPEALIMAASSSVGIKGSAASFADEFDDDLFTDDELNDLVSSSMKTSAKASKTTATTSSASASSTTTTSSADAEDDE